MLSLASPLGRHPLSVVPGVVFQYSLTAHSAEVAFTTKCQCISCHQDGKFSFPKTRQIKRTFPHHTFCRAQKISFLIMEAGCYRSDLLLQLVLPQDLMLCSGSPEMFPEAAQEEVQRGRQQLALN